MRFNDAIRILASRAPKVKQLTTNLLLDFDASSLALSDGAAVTSWASRSSAWTAAQADGAHQGTYVARSTLNGRPAVRMGANAYMPIAGFSRPAIAGFTFYYVADITTVSASEAATVFSGGTTNVYTSLGAARFPHAYINGFVDLGYDADTTTGPLCQMWTTGLTPAAYTGRTLMGSGTVAAHMGLTLGQTMLGSALANTGPRADVARVLVYEGTHDEATRDRVWDYLHQEYGVAGRPQKHSDGPIAHDALFTCGQSNDLGNALLADLPAPYNQPFPGVRMWNSSNPQYRSRAWEPLAPVYSADLTGFGPEVSLMRDLAADPGWPHPALNKCARGSTSLAVDWAPGTGHMLRDGAGPMWREMVDVYARAVAALPNVGDTLNVRAFVWIQGESDCIVEAHSLAYGANLAAFIAAVRSWLEKPQLPFFLVRLPATLGAPFGTYVGNTIAGQNAAAAADPHVHIIDTPLPLQGDLIHWTALGNVAGGHTLAARIIAEGA